MPEMDAAKRGSGHAISRSGRGIWTCFDTGCDGTVTGIGGLNGFYSHCARHHVDTASHVDALREQLAHHPSMTPTPTQGDPA